MLTGIAAPHQNLIKIPFVRVTQRHHCQAQGPTGKQAQQLGDVEGKAVNPGKEEGERRFPILIWGDRA